MIPLIFNSELMALKTKSLNTDKACASALKTNRLFPGGSQGMCKNGEREMR